MVTVRVASDAGGVGCGVCAGQLEIIDAFHLAARGSGLVSE